MRFERVDHELNFSLANRLREMDKEIRGTKIPVVLENLVLEDKVIPETVPRQFRNQPVVLVEVVAMMGKTTLGLNSCFSDSKYSLISTAV